MPNRQSIKGPSVCWGDVDNDNDDDLFIGGAANLPSKLYINNNGKLTLSKNSGLDINNNPEKYKSNSNNFKLFMEKQTQEFYSNLENLIQK